MSAQLVGGVTNKEARALWRGVGEMAATIEGLREDLQRVEKARAEWATLAAEKQRQLDELTEASVARIDTLTAQLAAAASSLVTPGDE